MENIFNVFNHILSFKLTTLTNKTCKSDIEKDHQAHLSVNGIECNVASMSSEQFSTVLTENLICSCSFSLLHCALHELLRSCRFSSNMRQQQLGAVPSAANRLFVGQDSQYLETRHCLTVFFIHESLELRGSGHRGGTIRGRTD